jgi:hypothetical protein
VEPVGVKTDDRAYHARGTAWRFDHFIREEALRVLGVVSADPGALCGFFYRCPQWLPHFHRHQTAESLFATLENVRGVTHHARPLRE